MNIDGISEVMYKYPLLITKDTKINGLHKGWLDIFTSFCDKLDFLISYLDVDIKLTEIKDKDGSLVINYQIVLENSNFDTNSLHSILLDLCLQLASRSTQVDTKTGEFLCSTFSMCEE